MRKSKVKIFVLIIMFVITTSILFINHKRETTIISKSIIEPNAVTLEKSNCTISEDNYVAKIKKYNGGAEAVIIDANAINCSKIEINNDAFLECTNLETILIDKSLVGENIDIEDFEINTDYTDEQYIMYTTTKEYNEEYQQYLELSEEEKNALEIIPDKYEVSMAALYSESMEENYNVSGILAEEIPESFDLRDKIDIKVENQGSTGICYAYASLTSVETNLALINGENLDFSEVHLAALTGRLWRKFYRSC